VRDALSLEKRARYVLRRYKQPAIVEEYIDGDEYSVPMWCGGETLPIGRIRYEGFPPGVARICSYRAKWAPKSWEYLSTPSEVPAKIDDDLAAKLRSVAVAAYHGVGCTGYARVDLRVSLAGQPYVIEVNPNPDISPGAGFVRAAAAAGFDYTAMIEKIVRYAMEQAVAKGTKVRARSTRRVVAAQRIVRLGVRQEKGYEDSDALLARSS
jgi:D-alanine-D-alanine ligase